MRKTIFSMLLLLIGTQAVAGPLQYIICKNKTSGSISIRLSKCNSAEARIRNISALTGAKGSDGSLRIYGDGSAGSVTIEDTGTLTDTNLQYQNLTIDPGVTLTVDTGTILRVTGTFINNGIINVRTYAKGGYYSGAVGTAGTVPAFVPASVGGARQAGSQGSYGSNATTLAGGYYGTGMFEEAARNMLKITSQGGSGGGGGGFGHAGGMGGGTFTVLAKGALVNNGTITADGDPGQVGSGGGGGGIIILASQVSVTNAPGGIMSARGGSGGNSTTDSGAGGGGGGGLIHLLSPVAPINSGTIVVTGGATGSNVTAVSANPRTGGGGGGSCAGDGGAGSLVSALGSSASNSVGSDGFAFATTVDPTSLF